jgi:hypothetical protein
MHQVFPALPEFITLVAGVVELKNRLVMAVAQPRVVEGMAVDRELMAKMPVLLAVVVAVVVEEEGAGVMALPVWCISVLEAAISLILFQA